MKIDDDHNIKVIADVDLPSSAYGFLKWKPQIGNWMYFMKSRSFSTFTDETSQLIACLMIIRYFQ